MKRNQKDITLIIESNLRNPAYHKVALDYHTPQLRLWNIIGDYMQLSFMKTKYDGSQTETMFMLKMQDGLTISQYESSGACHATFL